VEQPFYTYTLSALLFSMDRKKAGGLSLAGFLFALALAALQSSRSLLVTATKRQGEYNYAPEAALVIQEVLKLGISLALLLPVTAPTLRKSVSDGSFVAQLKREQSTILWYIVPAFAYAVQNSIVFYALLYISPPMFQLFTQLKIVTTAVAYRCVCVCVCVCVRMCVSLCHVPS
jgi:cytochrome c biogenesis factor